MEERVAGLERIQHGLWYINYCNITTLFVNKTCSGAIYPNGMQGKDIEGNSSMQTASNPMNNVAGNDNILDNIQVCNALF